MRFLRDYQHTAEKTHFCSYCLDQIHPGSLYMGRVYAVGDYIIDLKEHLDPSCPKEFWEIDEEIKGSSSRLEKMLSKKREVNIAA